MQMGKTMFGRLVDEGRLTHDVKADRSCCQLPSVRIEQTEPVMPQHDIQARLFDLIDRRFRQ